jgi:hypothetical protein
MAEKNHIVEKDGEFKVNKVDEAVERMDESRVNDILESFDGFRAYLRDRLALGKSIGLSEEQLAVAAQKIGDYLAEKVEPKNREEKLLQELWRVGTEHERHMLAHMLIKLIENE